MGFALFEGLIMQVSEIKSPSVRQDDSIFVQLQLLAAITQPGCWHRRQLLFVDLPAWNTLQA